MKTVLITTSGIGSRIEEYTKFTNKSLVKLGDKYILSYIIEYYPSDTEFIITLGHYGNHVKDFLELAYSNRNISFVIVDNYDKEGSSLAYSMLQAKDHLQKPFIFHCCDTIIDKYIDISNNCVIVSKSDLYNTYSSITVDNDNVKMFHPKGYKENSYIYLGIVSIKDYKEFWNNLEIIYDNNKLDSSLNDISSLKEMIKTITFKYISRDTFFDVGTIDTYNNARTHFTNKYNVLEKKYESICFLDRVIKFNHDKNINIKRVERAKILKNYIPSIISYKDNFISMELINGKVLSEVMEYGEIYKLLNWANKELWINTNTNEIYLEKCKEFYYIKSLDRIKKIKCLNDEKNYINGINTLSINELFKKIPFELLYTKTFTYFHGDFILDNIIKYENRYILIDWRDDFAGEVEYGDMYYDLAKLKHNIIFNHSNILNDLYSLEVNDNSIYIDIKTNYFLIKQLEDYDKFIKENNYNINKINILVALIWLNMSPLYEGKLSEFLFYFGKFHLYLTLQERP